MRVRKEQEAAILKPYRTRLHNHFHTGPRCNPKKARNCVFAMLWEVQYHNKQHFVTLRGGLVLAKVPCSVTSSRNDDK